ncbi:probable mediator of RNA polymerase II transcription subunit 26c isoform X2 [Rutidosis leptorrhynchoides]|uniref:probable mediator of RNA polymerase II transcription subunit 26c isoform X2 n=1 Tax=Rutidosis leptorrhynchoides TaxID=125765 RepID=UPI003A995907
MDLDEFRLILSNSNANVWEIIDAAIALASTDYPGELKIRRDAIVQRLYTPPQLQSKVTTLDNGGDESPLTPHSLPRGDDDDNDNDEPDPYGGLFDDEQTKILEIKEQLEDPHQSDDAVVELLETLADMDLTFTVLKETDIGRHVNRLRKHPSNDVRRLVKQLVSKWKDLVDEWVGANNGASAPSALTDGDSPVVQNVPRSAQNGYHQGPDFGYSPNPHNGSSGSEPEQQRPKAVVSKKPIIPSRPAPQSRPAMIASAASAPPPNRANRDQNIETDRLASARKRLHENYQEAQNAKKQRTIQVMDIHEIPKPRNGFIAKNKSNFQGRNHHR